MHIGFARSAIEWVRAHPEDRERMIADCLKMHCYRAAAYLRKRYDELAGDYSI